jgi:hypothetical protein
VEIASCKTGVALQAQRRGRQDTQYPRKDAIKVLQTPTRSIPACVRAPSPRAPESRQINGGIHRMSAGLSNNNTLSCHLRHTSHNWARSGAEHGHTCSHYEAALQRGRSERRNFLKHGALKEAGRVSLLFMNLVCTGMWNAVESGLLSQAPQRPVELWTLSRPQARLARRS